MKTADNTTTETEETTTPGVGGIVGDMRVTESLTVEDLVNLILDKRESLLEGNQQNVETFNQLQKISVKITNNLSVIDGAIAGISEFVTEDTEENDVHVTRLKELEQTRLSTLNELKLANSKRTLLISTIQATEISLGILNGILQETGNQDIKTTNLKVLKTEEQVKEELSN